jgi:hypothetical protein
MAVVAVVEVARRSKSWTASAANWPWPWPCLEALTDALHISPQTVDMT